MNIRKTLYLGYHRLAGHSLGQVYSRLAREEPFGATESTQRQLLISMLSHCERSVPYYSDLMHNLGDSFRQDPKSYLSQFPILTKDLIRKHFDRLRSKDLPRRKWHYNTSGGSTGEPVKFIQDQDYWDHIIATKMLAFDRAGRKFGEPTLWVWGSERDILEGSMGLKLIIANRLTNNDFFNAFRMNAKNIRELVERLNTHPPTLIIAYAQAIYEVAMFVEREKLNLIPQSRIITTSGTLYPFMREKIANVFQCKVLNLYGSREVGDIACECADCPELHVFQPGNYIEVVDDNGCLVPKGTTGNILITSLNNFAMPLIRYAIGDRGALSGKEICSCGRNGQILEKISGRNVDTFKAKDGTLVDGEYFTHLLYFREWVSKFQIIQKSSSLIIFRIIKTERDYKPDEIDEITEKTRRVIGTDCEIRFEFVNDIPLSASGKYRYTISEIGINGVQDVKANL